MRICTGPFVRGIAQGVVEQVTQRRHGQCSRHRQHPGGAAIGDHNTLLQSWSDLLDGCARNGRDSPVMAGFQSEAMMPPGPALSLSVPPESVFDFLSP
jgi:hypothetical protein